MRLCSVGVVALGFVAFTVPALAADLPFPSDPPYVESVAEGTNWTDFYIGGFGGYHHGEINESGCVGLCPVDPELDDAVAGVQFGADYQMPNNFVVGGFALIPILRPEDTVSLGPGLDFDIHPNFAIVAAARLGYAFDRWLPYIFGGVEYADVTVDADFLGTSDSNDYVGPAVGLGVEYKLFEHFSLDAKYLFAHLPEKTYDFGGGPSNYGEDGHNFLIGGNVRF